MLSARTLVVVSVLLLVSISVSAQSDGGSNYETLSKAEQMISGSGKGVLQGWIEIGSVAATGSVSVSVFEYRLAGNARQKWYAVGLVISGENKSKASRKIDEDEISSFIKDVKAFRDSDFRSGSTISSKGYRGSFQTRSGLAFSAFQIHDAKLKDFTLSVFPDTGVSAKFVPSEIGDFIELVTKAEAAIKEARSK